MCSVIHQQPMINRLWFCQICIYDIHWFSYGRLQLTVCFMYTDIVLCWVCITCLTHFMVMGSFEYIAIPTPPRHIFFNVRVIVLLNHFNEQRITSFCINVTGINFVFACIMIFNQLFLNMCMIVLIFIPSWTADIEK